MTAHAQTEEPRRRVRGHPKCARDGALRKAIGEFKYVGFFKKVRGSEFARMDTLVYSPVCLLMAAGVARVGATANP